MSQLKISTGDFYLSSRWRCSTGSNGTRFIVEGPTTESKKITFAYSLPVGSIINYVRVYATLGSPLSGAAVRTANNVKLAGEYLEECVAEQDVSQFDASAGSYSVDFKFKAYGSIFSDSNYHSASLSFKNVYLLIDYTVPNSEWSFSASQTEAGRSVSITIQPAEAACTHEVLVKFGALNETYTIPAGTTTYKLQVPYSWLNQIPNSTSGIAILQLRTLLNGVELGVSDGVPLTIVCPADVVPTVGAITAAIINPVWNACVQRFSRAKITLSNCQGAYGSTIEFGELIATPYVGGYSQGQINDTVEFELMETLSVSGTVSLQVSVVDSRGRKATKTTTINVLAYSEPSILQTVQGRADASGNASPQGTYFYAGATYSYTAAGTNSVRMQIYYREDGAPDWVLAYEGSLSSGVLTYFGGEFGTAIVYELKYVLTDDLGSSTAIRTIGTAYAFMKWSPQNNAIGFGCVPRSDHMFEIGQDWNVYAYGKDINSYMNRRNFVDNGYFLHPVNQRMFDEVLEPYGDTLMYLDRWEVAGSAQDANSWINCESTGIRLKGASTSNYIEMRQRFEDYDNMSGGWYTVNCCIDNVEYCHSFRMGQLTAGYTIGGLTLYSNSTAHLAFRNCSGNEITIQWVALYQGQLKKEEVPQYVPKGYGAELAECTRYFARVGTILTGWVSMQNYCGAYIAAQNIRVYIPLLNVLRSDPEVVYGGWYVAEPEDLSSVFNLYRMDGTQIPISKIVYRRTENGEVGLYITVDSEYSGATGEPVMLFVQLALHLSADV